LDAELQDRVLVLIELIQKTLIKISPKEAMERVWTSGAARLHYLQEFCDVIDETLRLYGELVDEVKGSKGSAAISPGKQDSVNVTMKQTYFQEKGNGIQTTPARKRKNKR